MKMELPMEEGSAWLFANRCLSDTSQIINGIQMGHLVAVHVKDTTEVMNQSW